MNVTNFYFCYQCQHQNFILVIILVILSIVLTKSICNVRISMVGKGLFALHSFIFLASSTSSEI